MNADVKRIIDKLRSLEKERAPSMTFDRCDAKVLLEYLDQLDRENRDYTAKYGSVYTSLKQMEASAGNSRQDGPISNPESAKAPPS